MVVVIDVDKLGRTRILGIRTNPERNRYKSIKLLFFYALPINLMKSPVKY